MKLQYHMGKQIRDDLTKVCILFDPKDGRIVHVHGTTSLDSKSAIETTELEARARKHAKHFGKSISGLKALHVSGSIFPQNHTIIRVNSTGDGLVTSPQKRKNH